MNNCNTCGFENDPTRVFCQNCGARLEITEKTDAPSAPPPPVYRYGREAQGAKTVKKAGLGRLVLTLIREVLGIAILAVMAAALIQALRPPNDIPDVFQSKPTLASMLAADIQVARESPYPRTLHISMTQANTFLATRLRGLDGQAGFLSARFERAYVHAANGALTLGTEQHLRTWPIYLQLGLRISSAPSGSTVEVISGTIGRLPIPHPLLPYFVRSFQGIFDGLQTPLSWLATASEITISPEGASVLWGGTAP